MNLLITWLGIAAIVVSATGGDVFISSAMKCIGDLDELRHRHGTKHVVVCVLRSGRMWTGIGFMAVAFFSLLFTLSRADVSLVAPASASLTFIANAFTARAFLRERVDRRRWIAVMLVAGGVALVAK